MTDRPDTWPIIYLLFWELKIYYLVQKVDVHESVHCDTIMEITNKLQLYRLG